MSFTSILFRKRACALASLSRATIPFSRGLAAVTAPKSGKPAAAPAAAKTGNKKAKKGGKGGKSGKAEDIDDGGQGVGLEITNEELDHRQFDKFLNAARGASRYSARACTRQIFFLTIICTE